MAKKKDESTGGPFDAEGANVCPDCDTQPIGIAQPLGIGGEVIMRYEVGCLVCPPVVKNGKRHSHTAKAFSEKDAIENWNNKEWITDNKV